MTRDIKSIAERMAARASERRRNLAGIAAQSSREARELRGLSEKVGEELKEHEAVKPLLDYVPGFYPSPPPVARLIVDEAEIEDGHLVLDPEAGKGDLLKMALLLHPGIKVEACEINSDLRAILLKKGYCVRSADFFDLAPDAGPYDRIVMNPPFKNHQDVDHVRHAFKFLKAGGRISALMSAGVFPEHRRERWAREFRSWLEGLDYELHDLPSGLFLDAERTTGVNVKLLIINKEEV